MKLIHALAVVMLTGCGSAALKPLTQRQYVEANHCKVDQYVNYSARPTRVYGSDGQISTVSGAGHGFTSYLCPNGVYVYIDYGE